MSHALFLVCDLGCRKYRKHRAECGVLGFFEGAVPSKQGNELKCEWIIARLHRHPLWNPRAFPSINGFAI